MQKDLISDKLISQYPNMNHPARNLISAISKSPSVVAYIAWLNGQLTYLVPKQRIELLKRIVSQHANSYHEAIAELVFIALWRKLGWPFEKDPEIYGKKPDFKVFYEKGDNSFFISEITVIRHNHPYKEIEINGDFAEINNEKDKNKFPTITQPITQSHRVLMRIGEKFEKYKNILKGNPFVLCIYIPGHPDTFFISDFQIRNALFGEKTINFTTGECSHKCKSMETEHKQNVEIGVFGFEKYNELNSIIVCKELYPQVTYTNGDNKEISDFWKLTPSFDIYANPLGLWANKQNNPFLAKDFPINGVTNEDILKFYDPKIINFY